MGIKRTVREGIEKFVSKYGYSLVKDNPFGDSGTMSDRYPYIVNQKKVEFSYEDFKNRDEAITLSWVIPNLGPGSGGHLDIIRAIHILHGLGIKNRIYIYNGNEDASSQELRKAVQEFYGYDLEDDEIYPSVKLMTYTDGVIATSWQTAYVVRNFNNCISKFYFVQDFEPFFYPIGAEYYFAENTYKFGYYGITAGGWLEKKLHDEYGMKTKGFSFSYERNLYHKVEKKDEKNRIFFYARPYTERRAFEMGVLALEELARRIPDIEVVLAGQKLNAFTLDFPYVDKGVMKLEDLCDMYSQCDMCLVLSMTNLSLLPMEVMASNSVVVSNKGANNEWVLNDENSILVEADPIDMADKMEYYLKHKDELAKLREKAYEEVQQFTWEGEIKKVYDFVTECIEEDKKSIVQKER
ncbi:MAG: glycosyltransferase family 4 protein [Lachnospiraceae bacterium]|nr:glycosyltransferase family 4 protein [Lachnospiraceae bacterium]